MSELSYDECMDVLNEGIVRYEKSKNETLTNFTENFDYDDNKGIIKCKNTGKTFKYTTGNGHKNAFGRMAKYARRELGIFINQYILWDVLVLEN